MAANTKFSGGTGLATSRRSIASCRHASLRQQKSVGYIAGVKHRARDSSSIVNCARKGSLELGSTPSRRVERAYRAIGEALEAVTSGELGIGGP